MARPPKGEFLLSYFEREGPQVAGDKFEHLIVSLWWSSRPGALIRKTAKGVMSYNLDDPLRLRWQSDTRTRDESTKGLIEGPYYGGSIEDGPLRMSAARTFTAFLECWANRGHHYTSINGMLIALGNVVVIKLRQNEALYDVVERRRILPVTHLL